MRKIRVLVCGALLAIGATASVAPGSAGAGAAAAAAHDPLVGSWDTGPIPLRKLRATLRAAGYSNTKITAFVKQFRMTNAYEFKIVFYRQNGRPFLFKKGWDPSTGREPDDADHGPYTLQPGHRFLATGADPATAKIRETFSYSVSPKRLKLHFIRLTEPGTKTEQIIDTMILRAQAARPYKRIQSS